MRAKWPIFFLFPLVVATAGAAVYKWVDEKGMTHYSATPPPGQKSQRIPTPSQPSSEEIDQARQQGEKNMEDLRQREDARRAEEAGRRRGDGLPATLPPAVSSEYLTTTSTGISLGFSSGHLDAAFFIFLSARPDIPVGALIEAAFENPVDIAQPMVVTHTVSVSPRGVKEDSFRLMSPQVHVLRCRNYEVTVRLYGDSTKKELLGVHRQYVQSRVDSALVGSMAQMMRALGQRNQLCP